MDTYIQSNLKICLEKPTEKSLMPFLTTNNHKDKMYQLAKDTAVLPKRLMLINSKCFKEQLRK